MDSRSKRSSYVSDSESSSGEEAVYFPPNKRGKFNGYTNGQTKNIKVKQEYLEFEEDTKRKCTSKNAVMARENRRRKKMYIQNLESEVAKLREDKGKLSSILENQSFVISELRKQVKYIKSVLANSSDIGNLIKNIQCNTGMLVTTSLDKTLTLNNDCVSKRQPKIARKTSHPWEDCLGELYHEDSVPEVTSAAGVSPFSEATSGDFDLSSLFTDVDLDIEDFNIQETTSFGSPQQNSFQADDFTNIHSMWNEHNYTNMYGNNCVEDKEDVGVCLHVSKHRVSLEFCQSCSENSGLAWKSTQ